MHDEKSPEVTTSIPKINRNGEAATEAIGLSKISQDPSHESFAHLSEQEREIISSLNPETAMLVGATGAAKGSRFLLDQKSHLIGRSQGSDIFLDDITVSRKHGLIERVVNGFEIVDTNSLNGIYLNGEILSDRKLLNSGDDLQIGKYKFTFFAKNNSMTQNQGDK
jgi:pSer/pThr/pTyr-binding forkhead associated (FHA) protein